MIGFVIASVVPMVLATALAVPWFKRSIDAEAKRTLDTHASLAGALLSERSGNVESNADVAAANLGQVLAENSGADIEAELAKQVPEDQNGRVVLFVDRRGRIRSSLNRGMARLHYDRIASLVESQKPSTFIDIVPQEQLKVLGLAADLVIVQKPSDQGSAGPEEVEGALAIVAVAPVKLSGDKRSLGSVVVVHPLKNDNYFVDSIANRLGGVATVFQNGVRVATNVKDAQGERAVGTPISDKVRAVTLKTGRPFRGEAFVVTKDYLAAYDALRAPSGKVVGMLFVGIDRTPYDAAVRSFALAMGAIIIVGAVIALAAAFFAANIFATPLAGVSGAADRVAGGDLTVTVPEMGFTEAKRMGRAFNTMISGLRTLLGQITTASDRLNTVAANIAHAASNEAESATSQASSVTEATATLEEINRSFGAVTDGARRVVQIAEDSVAVAENGRTAVEQSAGRVEHLAGGTLAVRESANALAEVAEDIDQVTFVIASIAEQTKILALNAAIEAARAGEAGKGFGVVATEIRTLADSVSTSIGRIEQLVRAIQSSSRSLSQTAEEQANLSQDTVMETLKTRESFDAIYDRMERTAEAAREIAAAAAQQQSAARAIVDVMQQVNAGVSGTAASARQVAEAATEVEREAATLAHSVRGFKTM